MNKRHPQELVIEAGRAERRYWADLWHYRELLGFLIWRDVLVRYKQTAIGIAWALIRPLLTMLIFTVIFSKLAKMPSDGVPYPLLVFAALLPWGFFASALGDSSASLINNANLISKIYFPRMILPMSAVMVAFTDFVISLLLLAGLMAWYEVWPTWRLLWLPALMLMAILSALGPGLFITALYVKYRDFRYVIPFLLQLGLYISPVGFSSSVIPERWRLICSLNPLVGVIDGFRWAICGTGNLFIPGLILSCVVIIASVLAGTIYFRRTEKSFADII